ncbi:MAG: hypothetical protein WC209_00860 [Ignavibacteriaceae bacterium]|jgi:hypothetical protein
MPSAKPDYAEIKLFRKKRNLYYNQRSNLFSKIYLECSSAIEGGYITQERAKKLLQFIESDNSVKTVFPNNLLYEILSTYCGKVEWNDISEGILLDFIAELYVNNPTPTIGIELVITGSPLNIDDQTDTIKPPEINPSTINMLFNKFPFVNNLRSYLYDTLMTEIALQDRFFGFTGDFDNYTRKTCFEKVRCFGSVPSDPTYYLDYLFVANKLINENLISNKLLTSIYLRRLYGNPQILTEDDWEKLVEKQKRGNYGNN